MNIWHRGALGDILYSWYWLSHSGQKANFYVPANGNFSPAHSTDQFVALKDLAALQPYIKSFNCAIDKPKNCDDMRSYVDGGPIHSDAPNIIKPYFLGHYYDWPGYEPWIFGVEPSRPLDSYNIINITARYHDHKFQWNQYLPAGPMLFIGLPQEYDEFSHYLHNSGYGDVARRMTYAPTANLLEAAQLIAGAKAFFGNCSSCLALAQGLGVKQLYVEVGQGTHGTCLFGHEKILNPESIHA